MIFRLFNKTILASMIGNSLEWFEYCIYTHFSQIIVQHFFPPNDFSKILIWLIFASGFVIRPLGGIILGIIGDKYGRKSVLSLTILSMAISTLGIGLLPDYSAIGAFATFFLFLFRLIQGFSLGGEFSSCIIYLVESCKDGNKNLIGSLAFVSMCVGILMGNFAYFLIFYFLPESTVFSYGWRIPFICATLIGFLGIYIRIYVKESAVFEKMKQANTLAKYPLQTAFKTCKNKIFLGILLYMVVTSNFYMFGIYFPTFLAAKVNFNHHFCNNIVALGLIGMSFTMLISGYLTDIIKNQKIVLLFGLLNIIFWSLILLNYVDNVFVYLTLCLSLGIYMGPIPTILVEMFTPQLRFTCIGLTYNLSAAIFGGTIPLISAYILQKYSINLVFYYLLFLDLIGLFVLLKYFSNFKTSKIQII